MFVLFGDHLIQAGEHDVIELQFYKLDGRQSVRATFPVRIGYDAIHDICERHGVYCEIVSVTR